MKTNLITLIAAVGSNWELGNKNQLPWKCPQDLKRFKKITDGQTLIMGRKTFDSLKKPLINRINIVITNNIDNVENVYFPNFNDVYFVNSIEKALKVANQFNKNIFVIGGASIYNQFIEKCLIDNVYLTVIPGNWEADVYFPEIDIPLTAKVSRSKMSPFPIFYFW